MARAETRTALALDTFAHIAGIHPLHFNQIDAGSCGRPIMQFGWQSRGSEELVGRVGREEVATCISQAENAIESWIGFPLLPRWIEDEQIYLPPLRGAWGSTLVHLDRGKYITGGIEQKVAEELGAAVVYSDEDVDGYDETATIGPITTTIFNPEEFALYYPGKLGDDAWEIRPITVTIDEDLGEVTITCRREQLVIEAELSTIYRAVGDDGELDGLEDANFLTEVDVYRHYNDPQLQTQFLWSCGGCPVSGGICQTCGYTTQFGCLRGVEPRLGMVTMSPGTWNAETLTFDTAAWSGGFRPERARVWYLAGHRDFRQTPGQRSHHDMDPALAQAVTVLALSYLPGPLCVCMTPSWQMWSKDLALQESDSGDAGSSSVSFKAGKRVLDNPFGTTRGAQRAWEIIARMRLGEVANYVAR